MSSGPNFLNLILPSCGFLLLGNVEIAHDLEPRHDGVAVRTRDLDIRHQRPVLPEPDLGPGLARVGLDVDVRRPLVVGVDDDLVDQLHQFVVRCGGDIIGRLHHRSTCIILEADSMSPISPVSMVSAP